MYNWVKDMFQNFQHDSQNTSWLCHAWHLSHLTRSIEAAYCIVTDFVKFWSDPSSNIEIKQLKVSLSLAQICNHTLNTLFNTVESKYSPKIQLPDFYVSMSISYLGGHESYCRHFCQARKPPYVCCGPKAHFHIVEQSFCIFNIGSKKMKMSRVSVMRKFQTLLVLLKRTHCIG